MSLKDWKLKKSSGLPVWKNIDKARDEEVFLTKIKSLYIVGIIGKNIDIDKSFKTKSQAFKYAKAYMKKH